ncbi:hypothetical protein BSPWISOXPB_7265 [uncultured Gammaproteobacteria bacterium]|nr:hypothetical protein BSPWISOXPB_7265 [uncultured Gammaproteobacteria bacterium]
MPFTSKPTQRVQQDIGHNKYANNPIPDKTRYLHYDNLGSIDTITDGQGNIVERMSYAAFGKDAKAIGGHLIRYCLSSPP